MTVSAQITELLYRRFRTVEELERLTGCGYAAVHTALHQLRQAGLLQSETLPKQGRTPGRPRKLYTLRAA